MGKMYYFSISSFNPEIKFFSTPQVPRSLSSVVFWYDRRSLTSEFSVSRQSACPLWYRNSVMYERHCFICYLHKMLIVSQSPLKFLTLLLQAESASIIAWQQHNEVSYSVSRLNSYQEGYRIIKPHMLPTDLGVYLRESARCKCGPRLRAEATSQNAGSQRASRRTTPSCSSWYWTREWKRRTRAPTLTHISASKLVVMSCFS